MYIIEIIPLASLPPQVPQLLSYYHNEPLPRGSIVEAPIGNRRVMATVISSEPLENQKMLLKKSVFELKKISKVISRDPVVSDTQFKIAAWLAKNYFSSPGICLKTVLPPFFLKKNVESKLKTQPARPGNSKLLLTRAKDIIKNIEPEIKNIIQANKQILMILQVFFRSL
jgi:primosomal protein N'